MPRHRLGVTALALDGTTLLQGHSIPRGILYSGGRDGMIVSSDLGLHMREKHGSDERLTKKEKWEHITGWANDDSSDEEEEEDVISGDIIGEVARKRRGSQAAGIGHQQWQLGDESDTPSRTRQRQSAQAHMDWINDIKLCNQNQTGKLSYGGDGCLW